MDEVFILKYDGVIASRGEMHAYAAADTLHGFSVLFPRVAECAYGEKIEIQTMVRDIRHGSFKIEFLNHLSLQKTRGLLSKIYNRWPSILKIIIEFIKPYKHLQGQPSSSAKKAENGSVFVENNSGAIINVNQLALNVVIGGKVSRVVRNFSISSLERLANKPMIVSDNREVDGTTDEESRYFGHMDDNDLLTEYTLEMYIKIVTNVLDGKSRWKFHGSSKAEYMIEEVLDYIPTTSPQGSILSVFINKLPQLKSIHGDYG